MSAKSPYNFVPAPEWKDVFKPDWAHQVSQDLPFSDGESGEIEIEITAETPIFIRSGKEPRDQVQQFPSFMQDGQKQYYIPGSSIKGMVRNVLEIMSRSMLNPELVSNDRFFIRDLRTGSYYKQKYQTNQVKAGWLSLDNDGNWTIQPTKWCFIHHNEVDEWFKTNFKRTFSRNENPPGYTLPNRYRLSGAKYKDVTTNWDFLDVVFDVEVKDFGHYKRKIATCSDAGEFEGTIVFTGQPGLRDEAHEPHTGKVHEFVFYDLQDRKINIAKQIVKDFLFSQADHDKNVENDWKRFKKDLFEGYDIPVFYQGTNTEIKHFGLAYLYKLPYDHSIHDLSPIADYLKNSDNGIGSVMDLSKTIFGHTQKDDSLKGRVMIGHALSSKCVNYPIDVNLVLASPKASYYNHYLQDVNDPRGYDKPGAVLGGFKKYYNRVKEQTQNMGDSGDNNAIFTKFKPLNAGSIFKTKIRYHNLRKVELGALLSALTFHGNEKLSWHQIGGAKPYGFGKIRINIISINNQNHRELLIQYLKEFEKLMNRHLNNGQSWFDSSAIKSLFSMGSGKNGSQDLEYPTLKEHQNRNSRMGKPNFDTNEIERYT